MSNDITKVLEAEVKRIAGEIQSLEATIATLKGQQAALTNTVEFYRSTSGKKPGTAAVKTARGAKRGPKVGSTIAKSSEESTKRGRPKKVTTSVAEPVAVEAPVVAEKKTSRKPAAKTPSKKAAKIETPKPVAEAVATPAPKAKEASKPKTKVAATPKIKETAAPKTKSSGKSKRSIAERTAPKMDSKSAVVAKVSKEASKPAVTKKPDKAPRGPKPGLSKEERGISLTAKVLELFDSHGELEPIEVAKGTGVNPEKYNSVRSTINILYLKNTLARRKKDGKSNTYSYARPDWYKGQGIEHELNTKKAK